jgi:short-subunit dehydrogenase
MGKVILIGSTSELGNAAALEFIKMYPDQYLSLFRVGRSIINSDLVWTNPNNVSSCVLTDLDSLEIERNDLVIIALGYLSKGLMDPNLGNLNLEEIHQSIEITGSVSAMAVIKVTSMLAIAGGGKVVVFSSVSASPILKASLFYGASKNFLEKIIEGLRPVALENNVHIAVIRPGFVATKLNEGRNKTLFSTTTAKVAREVVRRFPQKIIYVPSIFRIIELGLIRIKFLRKIANRKIEKSYSRRTGR